MSEQFEQALSERSKIESTIIQKAWESEDFKAELMRDPKGIFAREFGSSLPEGIEIQIVEETPNSLCLVIPLKPGSEGGLSEDELSDQELEAVAGGGKEHTTYYCGSKH